MHFGLYAFDLYLAIYEEAWEIAQGSDEQAKQGEAFAAFVTYAAGFADKAAFLREVPRLILLHNIHGIDIDPRATQIARLTLWLRAQRAWQEQGVEVAARPGISRSNVVCAEPMPGEKAMLRRFVEQELPAEERNVFGFLLEKIFDQMTLAGEAGSLLRIEDEIWNTITEAKRIWKAGPKYEQAGLFVEERPSGMHEALAIDLSGITDEDFWEQAEHRIYVALKVYAEQAQDGSGFQRRLFVDDTAQGFAFIDICRKRYDVALMNPPFGDASLPSKAYIDERYGDTKGDVYKAFVECFHDRLLPASHLGIISSRAGFFLGGSEDWRTRVVLRLFRPIALADLGIGVLDAMVEVAAYVLRSLSEPEARDLTLSLVPVLEKVVRDREDRFSLQKWQIVRDGLKRHQAASELENLEAHGFVLRSAGEIVRYTPLWRTVKQISAPAKVLFPPLVCVRALMDKNKEATLLDAISTGTVSKCFIAYPGSFAAIPGRTFAYWVSPQVLSLFERLSPLEKDGRIARQGGINGDDFRYLRLWWETSNCESARQGWKRKSFAKGGEFSRFYTDIHLVVVWDEERETFAGFTGLPHRPIEKPASSGEYFRRGITWSRRSQRGLSLRILPEDCAFADRGPSLFVDGNNTNSLKALLALTNSAAFRGLVSLQMAFGSFEVGVLQRTPWPTISRSAEDMLANLSFNAWARKFKIDSVASTSHAFLVPALLTSSDTRLAKRVTAWTAQMRTSEETVAVIQAEIDDLASGLYGLDAADCAALSSTLATEATSDAEACEDQEEDAAKADASALTADLLAYALGTAFGRWDVRYAKSEQAAPELPDPFAQLPVCPPGQLQNAQGLPARAEDVPAAYPVSIPWDGILVDDPNHPLDLERRVYEVIEIICSGQEGVSAQAIDQEACDILGVKSLRDYFRKPAGFFSDHLKRYSKSRRQAPIYWQLTAGNGSYSAWLYYHRFTSDTLYRVLGDFVEPRIQEAEREQFELESQGGLSGDGASRLREEQALLQDLRLFKSELELVAPLWNPNLNDGVIINHAIIWRITSYTPWQKRCKECWDKLVKGDYDWSHLAFHLWPERVIRKCTTDRSLAIAHGLEERLWQETSKGSWLQRQVPEAELQALLAEYSKPAVQNALERFLAASPPVAAARTRAPRATKSSSTGTTRRTRGSAPEVDAETSRQTLLVLTAAPSEGLGRNAIAELLAVEAASLTAVIKQLKEGGQIEQLGAARGAKYRLTESGLAAVESKAGEGE